MKLVGITRALAISGCTDFRFCDEEALWKGSECHKIFELYFRGTLDRKSVPADLKGYLEAIERFSDETHFLPRFIEHKVESKELGCRGRIDAVGWIRGKLAIIDFKTGSINPAVALQLVLGGHMLDEKIWFARYAVQIKANGRYSFGKEMPLKMYGSDLATAKAAVRISRWKLDNGLV